MGPKESIKAQNYYTRQTKVWLLMYNPKSTSTKHTHNKHMQALQNFEPTSSCINNQCWLPKNILTSQSYYQGATQIWILNATKFKLYNK